MIGLIVAIILFNTVAFLTNKRLTKNQIVHIWMFTVALQVLVDLYIDLKYLGYWYFTKDVDWASLPALTILIPPVNIMFLNWYPFHASTLKKFFYYLFWVTIIVIYEALSLLPEPWGYFNYGWWKLAYSAMVDPLLFLLLLCYYKWICKIEKDPD